MLLLTVHAITSPLTPVPGYRGPYLNQYQIDLDEEYFGVLSVVNT